MVTPFSILNSIFGALLTTVKASISFASKTGVFKPFPTEWILTNFWKPIDEIHPTLLVGPIAII